MKQLKKLVTGAFVIVLLGSLAGCIVYDRGGRGRYYDRNDRGGDYCRYNNCR